MLVTKDSEDDVDLDQEVAYHVCVASRARRADVWRVYASLVKFSILKFRSVSLSKQARAVREVSCGLSCHARASKREAPRADAHSA